MAVAWIAGFGLASARMAIGVDRRAPVWFALGALFGPVALIVLMTAPPGRCRTCGTPTILWSRTCRWCHEDVRTSPAATVAIVERMSQRIADARPAEPQPEPETARVVEAPKPYVIRSDAVRPQHFTLTGASPRARIRTAGEPVHSPEVAPGSSGLAHQSTTDQRAGSPRFARACRGPGSAGRPKATWRSQVGGRSQVGPSPQG